VDEDFTAILVLNAGARQPPVAVILVNKGGWAGTLRHQSARRVAPVIIAAVACQCAICIVTPALKTVVDESIVGSLRLAPDAICLLRDFVEAVALITLPRSTRRPAVFLRWKSGVEML